jgi:hypothetical protein
LQRGLSFIELLVMRLMLWHGWSESLHLVITERSLTNFKISLPFSSPIDSGGLQCLDAVTLSLWGQWIETNIIIICQVCWREWNQKCFKLLNWCENWWPCRKLDSFLNWDCSFHLNGHRYLSYKYSVVWFFFSQGPELLQFIVWKAICWEIHSFISVAKGTLLWLLFQVTLVWCLLVW